jgi:hypothetical protein
MLKLPALPGKVGFSGAGSSPPGISTEDRGAMETEVKLRVPILVAIPTSAMGVSTTRVFSRTY